MAKKWLINATPTLPSSPIQVDINFDSPGVGGYEGPFESIYIDSTGIKYGWFEDYDPKYQNNQWTDNGFRTITFETEPSGQLLSWMQANANPAAALTTASGKILTTSTGKIIRNN